MGKKQSDHEKTSLTSIVEQANSRLADKESKQRLAKERYREAHLKRKELRELAKENLEAPKKFALDVFLDGYPRRLKSQKKTSHR